MKPLLLMTLPLLALVGCQTLEQEIVLPGVDDSPPAVLLGHVPGGLPADFYEDAAEVTGQAVLRYVALSDQITRSGGDKVVEVLSVTPVLVDRGCHSETLVAGRC